ncbi:MAG TPA: hypothetical protein PK668_26380 [Myxococcota bacterium]|nr:hypothetical protein [Myxococcota bacterium]HRY97055.1 hypothetical protein [Myxococcota bacterium]HSA20974.1 hypothetical protein [Myxococcota bacterium]
MKALMSVSLVVASLALCCGAVQAGPAAPSEKKLQQDLAARWKTQAPDQTVADVELLGACAAGEIELAGPGGKPRKQKTCLLKVNLYATRGYRVFIYRQTEVHYAGSKLVSLQLGELEKAWKRGGVPAPSPEQVLAMLQPEAAARLGAEPALAIVELGQPRPHGEVYRWSVVLDADFTKDGKRTHRDRLMATFESDGTDWRPVPALLF